MNDLEQKLIDLLVETTPYAAATKPVSRKPRRTASSSETLASTSTTSARPRPESSSESRITLAFDPKKFAVGCVLLQAICGGDRGVVSTLFDPNCWIVGSGVDGLRKITGTIDDWRAIAVMSNSIWSGRNVDRDELPPDWKQRAKRALKCLNQSPKKLRN